MHLYELKKGDIFIFHGNDEAPSKVLSAERYFTEGGRHSHYSVKIVCIDLLDGGQYEYCFQDKDYHHDQIFTFYPKESIIEASFLGCNADEKDDEFAYAQFLDLHTYETRDVGLRDINYDIEIEEGKVYKLHFIDKYLVSAIPCEPA